MNRIRTQTTTGDRFSQEKRASLSNSTSDRGASTDQPGSRGSRSLRQPALVIEQISVGASESTNEGWLSPSPDPKPVLKEGIGEQLVSQKKQKRDKTSPNCMELVIKHIRSKPYTSALLVKDINLYGSSAVNRCLKKLKEAGFIGAVWDHRKICFVYYNIKV